MTMPHLALGVQQKLHDFQMAIETGLVQWDPGVSCSHRHISPCLQQQLSDASIPCTTQPQ